jgi:biopolymer transport protein ExbB/TolQ
MPPSPNDLSQKQDQLAQFDRHISEVKQSIEKKLDLIEKLKREGRDTAEAEELLDTLIQMLRAMLDHRLAILKRLAPLSPARLK